jgi:outer membrane protein OmpA-like peptidoglycan-associated protein
MKHSATRVLHPTLLQKMHNSHEESHCVTELKSRVVWRSFVKRAINSGTQEGAMRFKFAFRQRAFQLCLVGTFGTALMSTSSASAQTLQRFALRAELGAGTMLSDYQRNTNRQQYGGNVLGYDTLDLQANLRLGFQLFEPLTLQVGFTNAFFFTDSQDGTGRVMAAEGGLRFEPRVGTTGRLFLDVNGGWARTGPLDRVTVNAGVGFEFNVNSAFALGPMFRFSDVIQPTTSAPSNLRYYDDDAMYWMAGLSMALRVPPPAPPPPPPSDVLDTDCDTIPDERDVCPTVPAGDHPDATRLGCPIPDTDDDGLRDPDDQCPRDAEGDYPDPAHPGCPDADNDHDGVLNPQDRCPQMPVGPINDPERPGCPHPHPLAVLERDRIRITQQVHFDTNRYDIETVDSALRAENHAVLDQVVSLLQYHTAIVVLEVQGHTDDRCTSCPQGPRLYNLALSQHRAHAIKDYLTNHGVDAARLTAEGYGQGRPIEPNTTPNGRLANRRVQFQILRATWAEAPAPLSEVTPTARRPHLPVSQAPTTPCRVPAPRSTESPR